MSERAERLLERAKQIIEIGDIRLLAADGPAGGQPPDISMQEWKDLYEAICGALADLAQRPEPDEGLPTLGSMWGAYPDHPGGRNREAEPDERLAEVIYTETYYRDIGLQRQLNMGEVLSRCRGAAIRVARLRPSPDGGGSTEAGRWTWREWTENAARLLHELQSMAPHVSWGSESWDVDHAGIALERALQDFSLIRGDRVRPPAPTEDSEGLVEEIMRRATEHEPLEVRVTDEGYGGWQANVYPEGGEKALTGDPGWDERESAEDVAAILRDALRNAEAAKHILTLLRAEGDPDAHRSQRPEDSEPGGLDTDYREASAVLWTMSRDVTLGLAPTERRALLVSRSGLRHIIGRRAPSGEPDGGYTAQDAVADIASWFGWSAVDGPCPDPEDVAEAVVGLVEHVKAIPEANFRVLAAAPEHGEEPLHEQACYCGELAQDGRHCEPCRARAKRSEHGEEGG